MKFYKGMNLLKLDLQHFATSSAMSTSNQYIKYSITITQGTQSVTGNYSPVTVVVKVWRTNTGYESYDSKGTCYCKINGTTYSSAITASKKVTYNSNTVFFEKTLDIPHNADGTKTLTCSAWFEGSTVFKSSEQSYSQTLTTIPRASVLGTISNFTIGNAITIPITKYSSSFADTLNIYVGDTWIKRIEGLTNGQSVTFTTAELNTIYANIPNSTTATFKFVNTTYSGANSLGTSTKTATGTIPSSIKPTIGTVTIAEGNTDVVSSSWGVYVKNKSKLKFTISATAGTGSSISSIKTTINGATYNGSPITTNVINTSGSLTATITATDKRNRTNSTTKTIEVVDWAEPYIDAFDVIRCDADGNANDSGTHAKVSLKGGYYSVNGKNTATYVINYKKITDDEYQTTSFDLDNTNIDTFVILSNIDENSSYEFVAVISDYFTGENPTKKTALISSAFTTVDYKNGGKGVAFGKVAEEEDLLDVAFNLKVHQDVNVLGGLYIDGQPVGAGDALPIDSIFEYEGDEVPEGYVQVPDVNDYVLGETIIGNFAGKTLYRNVMSIGTPSANPSYPQYLTSGSIDLMINAYGTYMRPGTTYNNLIPGPYTNWEAWLYDFREQSCTLKFSTNQWNAGIEKLYLIFEYTKK